MKRWHQFGTVLVLLTVAALPASAAPVQPVDGSWLAWQGCWHAQGDPVDNILCIVTDGDAARILTVANGKIQAETRMSADGRARPVSLEGCSGTESAEWSADGQRIFARSDMICGGSVHRKVTGIMAMPNAEEWLNVQAVKSGDQVVARTKRYVAVEPINAPESLRAQLQENRLARETSRYAASAHLDLDDIAEASHKTDSNVVSEWLTAMHQEFDLTGKNLTRLADQGVPAAVIDVVVALSNPEHFAVRAPEDRDDEYPYRPRAYGSRDDCYGYSRYSPWLGATSSYDYGRYSYGNGNGCYYSPWGYDGYGWRSSVPVIVVRGDGGEAADGAKVTRNGYSSGSNSKGKARPRNDDGTAQPSRTEAASTRSSDSGHSSGSSGSSSSGSSTGRTAHPRDK